MITKETVFILSIITKVYWFYLWFDSFLTLTPGLPDAVGLWYNLIKISKLYHTYMSRILYFLLHEHYK